jgi:response regulator NasT
MNAMPSRHSQFKPSNQPGQGLDVRAIASRPLPAGLPRHPKRILVADDEHLVAAELTASLADLGYTTIGPAVDGHAAIELARTSTPDLALLDIRMPKVNGLEAAKALFKDLGIPVIILSAYSDPEYVENAMEAGVFAYLIKPAQRDQIRAAINIAWGRFLAHVECQIENQALARKLEERKIIEKAKWLLVSRKNMQEPDAMKFLQKSARDARRTLVDVASEVLAQFPDAQ